MTLTATPQAALTVVNNSHPRGCERAVLLIRGESSAGAADGPVRDAAIRRGWQVFTSCLKNGDRAAPDLFLSERRSVLLQDLRDVFVPDLVPDHVFTGFCRRMAGARRQDKEQVGSVSAACSLDEVLPLTLAATADRWGSSTLNDGLAVPLGRSASGTKTLDLQSDGPHLLVAGTTGSGKSELLRSLTLALALSHPPERVVISSSSISRAVQGLAR